MERDELRALQAPLKEQYREQPQAALVTLSASGSLGDGVSCSVNTGRALAEAGLHPASGGDGSLLCSGDMLLEALVACAGVTLAPSRRRSRSRSAPAPSTPKATSTSAARSASTKRPPSASPPSASRSRSTPTRPRNSSRRSRSSPSATASSSKRWQCHRSSPPSSGPRVANADRAGGGEDARAPGGARCARARSRQDPPATAPGLRSTPTRWFRAACDVMSSTTRLTSRISLIMREAICSSRS